LTTSEGRVDATTEFSESGIHVRRLLLEATIHFGQSFRLGSCRRFGV
jgi:hypothetical protein